jgi:aconitate hydratase
MPNPNSFDARASLEVGGKTHEIFRLDALQAKFDVARLPYSLKILLENLLRTEGNGSVEAKDIEALATWDAKAEPSKEIAFSPARVLMQDFTGVPAIVDLAAMRDAMADEIGGDPAKINPLVPPSSSSTTASRSTSSARATRPSATPSGSSSATRSATPSCAGARARSRLRRRPAGHRHRPPGQPRVPLARRVLQRRDGPGVPDTLVGTDSHTTMVNGLGVLGWGVGGIEAEAAMLGQPMSMLIPHVSASSCAATCARARRDRPRPHRHRDPAPQGRRGQVRRVLRPGARRCRSPTGRRSGT